MPKKATESKIKKLKNVLIIVAHPDDETLWAGGTILGNPKWKCFILCLCRKSDEERALKFYSALKILKAEGMMGDLDDGPGQKPLGGKMVKGAILELLPSNYFDLVITHNPNGEYTRHLRHEEISRAVLSLWNTGKIKTDELWTFAYEDGNNEYFPRPENNAPIYQVLKRPVWLKKYSLITETYGFEKKSWEAETTPRAEAFWRFAEASDAWKWLKSIKKQKH